MPTNNGKPWNARLQTLQKPARRSTGLAPVLDLHGRHSKSRAEVSLDPTLDAEPARLTWSVLNRRGKWTLIALFVFAGLVYAKLTGLL